MTPVARRVLGEGDITTLKIRYSYARALCGAATRLDDLREAVTTLEDTERTARRVLGGTHPMAVQIDDSLREARAHLRTLETPPKSA